MATESQITELRRMIGELEDTEPWSDSAVADLIDTALGGSLNWAAWQAWDVKASLYAGMVDTSESGSSRKSSQTYENAVKQADRYRGRYMDETTATAEPDLSGQTYTLPIERP